MSDRDAFDNRTHILLSLRITMLRLVALAFVSFYFLPPLLLVLVLMFSRYLWFVLT